MTLDTSARPHGQPKVQRQRRLPLSKAIEIAWKQIRMRLSRSLLVTSGIVLAIAFLIAIQINDTFADGMRGWINSAGQSAAFAELREERKAVEARLAEDRIALRSTPQPDAMPDPKQTIQSISGTTAEELKQQLGELPTDPASLERNLAISADYRAKFIHWLTQAREALALRERLSEPKLLEARLADNGVPTRAEDVAAARSQNRWLLGLALLVAFVGILNAMLMSVTERFREIGTMKCLGALDSFIVKLFLIESLFQGVVGTLVGLILGVAVSLLMNFATYGSAAFYNFQSGPMLQAIAISAAVGIVLTVAGAVWPARQAARMHPIEAMRVEA